MNILANAPSATAEKHKLSSVTIVDPFSDGHHVSYAIWVCEQLHSRGIEINIIGPAAFIDAVRAEVRINKSKVLSLYDESAAAYYDKGKWHEERSSYRFTRTSLETAREWGSEITHFVFLDSFILSLLAARRYAGQMRLYATLHWAYFLPRFAEPGLTGQLKATAQLLALNMLLRTGVRLQVHTPSFETEIGRRTKSGQVRYIPYPADPPVAESMRRGSDLRDALGIAPETRLLLAFGGTRRNKGVDIAIRSLAYLPENHHLVVLGAAHDFHADQLISLAQTHGVEHRLHLRLEFLPREEYEPYFAAADTVVLPYTRSFAGQSGVMVIAGSMGVPVTASDSGSLAELVHQSNLGHIFSSENPEDMARAVLLNTRVQLTIEERLQRQEIFLREHAIDDFGTAILDDYGQSHPHLT